jgi:hypothetical protein
VDKEEVKLVIDDGDSGADDDEDDEDESGRGASRGFVRTR